MVASSAMNVGILCKVIFFRIGGPGMWDLFRNYSVDQNYTVEHSVLHSPVRQQTLIILSLLHWFGNDEHHQSVCPAVIKSIRVGSVSIRTVDNRPGVGR